FDREDALRILMDAIIGLARGEDVDPNMLEHIAEDLDSGLVQLAFAPQAKPGNRGNPDRDAGMAGIFEYELEAGRKRPEALHVVAEAFGVDPRSVERALRRYNDALRRDNDVKSDLTSLTARGPPCC